MRLRQVPSASPGHAAGRGSRIMGCISGTGAVAVVVVVIVLPYMFTVAAPILPAGPTGWLLRLTPASAFAVQQTLVQYPQVTNTYTAAYGYYPLPPGAGLAVLCTWAALALGPAVFLLRRRDA